MDHILVDGVRPLAINKRTLVTVFGGASKIVDRLLHASRYSPEMGWLVLSRVGSPGVGCLIDTASAELAYRRFKSGEFPPLLPSEIKSELKKFPAGSAPQGETVKSSVRKKGGSSYVKY